MNISNKMDPTLFKNLSPNNMDKYIYNGDITDKFRNIYNANVENLFFANDERYIYQIPTRHQLVFVTVGMVVPMQWVYRTILV